MLHAPQHGGGCFNSFAESQSTQALGTQRAVHMRPNDKEQCHGE